jgi:hypothetical protein
VIHVYGTRLLLLCVQRRGCIVHTTVIHVYGPGPVAACAHRAGLAGRASAALSQGNNAHAISQPSFISLFLFVFGAPVRSSGCSFVAVVVFAWWLLVYVLSLLTRLHQPNPWYLVQFDPDEEWVFLVKQSPALKRQPVSFPLFEFAL